MRDCEYFQGQLAAALYEPLTAQEQAELDGHLAECAPCRQDQHDLRQLIAELPVRDIPLDTDLLPQLHKRLTESNIVRFRPWRWALPAAAAVLFVSGLYALRGEFPASTPGPVAANTAESTMGQVLQAAAGLVQSGNHQAAYTLLTSAIKTHAGDSRAGEVQMALADIEFTQFQHYDRAFDAYTALKRDYWETFRSNRENADRMEVLDEARVSNFEPLYALNRAEGSFEALESVVSQYPATFVASLAVSSMEDLVRESPVEGSEMSVASLEKVREKCTNPTAIDQVNVAMGNRYWKDLNDPSRARDLYVGVVRSESVALARVAEQKLAELDAAL